VVYHPKGDVHSNLGTIHASYRRCKFHAILALLSPMTAEEELLCTAVKVTEVSALETEAVNGSVMAPTFLPSGPTPRSDFRPGTIASRGPGTHCVPGPFYIHIPTYHPYQKRYTVRVTFGDEGEFVMRYSRKNFAIRVIAGSQGSHEGRWSTRRRKSKRSRARCIRIEPYLPPPLAQFLYKDTPPPKQGCFLF